MQTVAQKQALVTVHRRVKKVRRNHVALIDLVATWLETDDTITANFVAYGICIASSIMLTTKVLSLLL